MTSTAWLRTLLDTYVQCYSGTAWTDDRFRNVFLGHLAQIAELLIPLGQRCQMVLDQGTHLSRASATVWADKQWDEISADRYWLPVLGGPDQLDMKPAGILLLDVDVVEQRLNNHKMTVDDAIWAQTLITNAIHILSWIQRELHLRAILAGLCEQNHFLPGYWVALGGPQDCVLAVLRNGPETMKRADDTLCSMMEEIKNRNYILRYMGGDQVQMTV